MSEFVVQSKPNHPQAIWDDVEVYSDVESAESALKNKENTKRSLIWRMIER